MSRTLSRLEPLACVTAASPRKKSEDFLRGEAAVTQAIEPHDIPRGTDEGPRPLYFRFKRKQAPVSGWRGYQA